MTAQLGNMTVALYCTFIGMQNGKIYIVFLCASLLECQKETKWSHGNTDCCAVLLLVEQYAKGQNLRIADMCQFVGTPEKGTKWFGLNLRKHNNFGTNVLGFDSGRSLCM